MALEEMALSAEETAQMEDSTEPVEETSEPVAEEPAETPAPEPVASEPAPEPEKVVPLASLQEARHETKMLKERLRQFEETKAELKRQIDEIRQQRAQAEIPPYEQDPLGNLDHRLKQEQQRKIDLEAKLQQFEQHQQAQVMAHHVTALENDFRRQNPDYDKAFNHLIEIKKGELELLGVDDVDGELARLANGISMQAINQGKNPADVVYQMAKRYGYRNAPVAPPVKKLEAVQAAQAKAGKTLTKGGDVDAPPSALNLANEKFNIFDKNFDTKWKELFGE